MNPLPYNNCFFHVSIEDIFNVDIRLLETQNPLSENLWECNLKGLWCDENERLTPEIAKVWEMHNEGDYFQHTLIRHNYTMHPHTSYTAWFHELILLNRSEFNFIKRLYSTSKLATLSMGYAIYPDAERFWAQQVENEKAVYIEVEERYKALI